MREFNGSKMQNALRECSALALIICIVWGIVIAGKGIYPFGRQSLAVGDMSQQIIPAYTHIWDVLHGEKNLFFDWYAGLGNNMAGTVHEYALISPFNLFFLFIKRSSIEASMSIFILIKLMAISFSMRFLVQRWFSDISSAMRILFCIMYAFSPFNMEYYYVSRWHEMSFMFPLLMYGYFRLMNEGKTNVYIVCLAISTMLSTQNMYMLIVMLLLLTGTLPLLDTKYKKRLGTLLGATVIGMMISAWLWIPAGLQTMRSNRISYGNSIKDIWFSVWVFHPAKWMKLCNMSLPLSCFLLYGWRNKRGRDTRFFAGLLLFLCIPIVLESTNLLWHGGSYMGFTMRFSYMLAFWILVAGAYAYSKDMKYEHPLLSKTVSGIFIIAANMICAALQFFYYIDDSSTMKNESSTFPIVVIVLLAIGLELGLLYQNDNKYIKSAWIIVLIQIISLEFISVYTAGDIDSTYIALSNDVLENSGEEENPLVRTKADVSIQHNYPIIMRRYAASGYWQFNSQEQMVGMDNRGYAQVGVRMSDYGGTLISDALMGVMQIFTRDQVSDSLYQREENYGEYSLYSPLFFYDQGIKLTNPEREFEPTENPFIYQNQLAEALVGAPLLDLYTKSGERASLQIEDESVLYLFADNAESFTSVAVEDNNSGERYEIDLLDMGWMNGILELGVWEDALLEINIASDEQVDTVFYAIASTEKFKSYMPEIYDGFTVHKDNTALTISLQGAADGEYLYLPIYPDEGWKCVVNDEEVKIQEFAELAMAIPLQKGDNNIEISFMPPGLYWGMRISVIGLIIFIILLIKNINTLSKPRELAIVNQILYIADELVFLGILLMFYLIPFVCFVIWVFIKNV